MYDMMCIYEICWKNACFTINAFRPSHQLYWFHFMQLPICSHACVSISYCYPIDRLLNRSVKRREIYRASKEKKKEWVRVIEPCFYNDFLASRNWKAGYCIHLVIYSRINLVKASAMPCMFSCISFYLILFEKYVHVNVPSCYAKEK